MKHIYVLLGTCLFFIFIFISLSNQTTIITLPFIKEKKDIINLFPKSETDVKRLAQKAIIEANFALNLLYSIKDQNRTFENTMLLLDRAESNFNTKSNLIYILTMVHPDKNIREIAEKVIIELNEFALNNFAQNKKLYQAIKEYNNNRQNLNENLSDANLYFINETLNAYKKAGLEKDDETRELIKKIGQELTLLSLNFEKNINNSNRFIKVSKEDLEGLDQNFIDSLKSVEDPASKNKLYILGVDYPTYFKILEECSCEKTRKALWNEFNLRGYPENKEVLNKIAKLRNDLAQILDFENYAHLDISDQMAKHPSKVSQFLNEISTKCKEKASKEFELLKKDLPNSVTLVDNKIKPWDLKFIINYYKKKYLMIDENLISEFFPSDYILANLFNIYEKFFGIKFEKFKIEENDLWHKDVEGLKVYKNNKFIGTLLLDLWPRDNKYTHACQVGLISGIKNQDGDIICPALVLVITNFTKPTENKPSLLRRQEVITFFHECGHAIHSLLGATELGSHSGTSVKGDFVEMPSQMLEEWMMDKEILKLITQHYNTKEQLPDNIIENIQKNKNCFAGTSLLTQISYSLMSLNLFSDTSKDIETLWKESHNGLNNLISDCSDHGYCSFGHLTNYGSKYYGYLWSQVYAKDLFNKIKEHGLLNQEIGEVYTAKILSQGGSKEPNDLIKDFLGRESNSDAFFNDLGI